MGTNGMDDTGQITPMDGRMAELEALFLGGPLATKHQLTGSFSIETLVDVLVVLFDECSTSSLRREKTVSEFIELGEWEPSIDFIIQFDCQQTHPHGVLNPQVNHFSSNICIKCK